MWAQHLRLCARNENPQIIIPLFLPDCPKIDDCYKYDPLTRALIVKSKVESRRLSFHHSGLAQLSISTMTLSRSRLWQKIILCDRELKGCVFFAMQTYWLICFTPHDIITLLLLFVMHLNRFCQGLSLIRNTDTY